jgi:hypothetical protein
VRWSEATANIPTAAIDLTQRFIMIVLLQNNFRDPPRCARRPPPFVVWREGEKSARLLSKRAALILAALRFCQAISAPVLGIDRRFRGEPQIRMHRFQMNDRNEVSEHSTKDVARETELPNYLASPA